MSKHRQITKELAEKIAKKLGAVISKDGAHAIAAIYYNGNLIATFGIRHGSNKEQGHDHIMDEIFVNAHKAKRLGQCPMSKQQWLDCLQEKGLLPIEDLPVDQQEDSPENESKTS